MTGIICKRCQATDSVKNGVVRGVQRYRCRACGCDLSATKPRGKPAAVKALAMFQRRTLAWVWAGAMIQPVKSTSTKSGWKAARS